MMDEKARVLANREVVRDFFLARLAAPCIAAEAAPGQFIELQVGEDTAPLLRLPLSIGAADPGAGTIDLLYERIGPKSRILSRMGQGCETACLGPLGRGFQAPPADHTALLIGGGIGLPPLLFWGHRLNARGWDTVLLAGARSAVKHLPDALLKPAARIVHRATDDGSVGRAGLVTDLLEEELEKARKAVVYACGPHSMLAAVAAMCRMRDIPCQVSLEEYMACGIGICVGCAVEVVQEAGASEYARYRRVCVDGPVFDARQVRWEGR